MKKVFITFFLVILLDQLLKVYIKLNFAEGMGMNLIPGFIELTFVENEGMAFGWKLPGSWGKIILSVFRLFAAGVIIWYIKKLLEEKAHRGLIICVSMILAGAVGNIIDSAVYGLIFSDSEGQIATAFQGGYESFLKGDVVDMLHFTVAYPEWWPWSPGRLIFPPIFNLADASISAGVILILIRQKTFFNYNKQVVPANSEEEVSSESSVEDLDSNVVEQKK